MAQSSDIVSKCIFIGPESETGNLPEDRLNPAASFPAFRVDQPISPAFPVELSVYSILHFFYVAIAAHVCEVSEGRETFPLETARQSVQLEPLAFARKMRSSLGNILHILDNSKLCLRILFLGYASLGYAFSNFREILLATDNHLILFCLEKNKRFAVNLNVAACKSWLNNWTVEHKQQPDLTVAFEEERLHRTGFAQPVPVGSNYIGRALMEVRKHLQNADPEEFQAFLSTFRLAPGIPHGLDIHVSSENQSEYSDSADPERPQSGSETPSGMTHGLNRISDYLEQNGSLRDVAEILRFAAYQLDCFADDDDRRKQHQADEKYAKEQEQEQQAKTQHALVPNMEPSSIVILQRELGTQTDEPMFPSTSTQT